MEPSISNGAAGPRCSRCTGDSHAQPARVSHSPRGEAEEFTKFPLSVLTFVKD